MPFPFPRPTRALAALAAAALTGCGTSGPGSIADRDVAAAYRDEAPLAAVLAPRAPWARDSHAPGVAYAEDGAPRVVSDWTAPAGTPSPLPELAARAAASGYDVVALDPRRLRLRRGSQIALYTHVTGERLHLDTFER